MSRYGYARVSSRGQAANGNSLECQEEILKSSGAEKIYFEVYTGTKKRRPALDEMLSELKPEDEVIVSKLDRLSRSAKDGIDIIDILLEKGVSINILNMGKFDDSPTGKLMRTMLFAFAEFERDSIVQRTREGKAYARANNPDFREGGVWKIPENFSELKKEVDEGTETVSGMCRRLGVTRPTWYNWRKRFLKEEE